ncbi:MAG: hypothetical protein Tsb0015_11810 [Simkaniaceae bacterium]
MDLYRFHQDDPQFVAQLTEKIASNIWFMNTTHSPENYRSSSLLINTFIKIVTSPPFDLDFFKQTLLLQKKALEHFGKTDEFIKDLFGKSVCNILLDKTSDDPQIFTILDVFFEIGFHTEHLMNLLSEHQEGLISSKQINDLIAYCISKGVNVNSIDENSQTFLHKAVQSGNISAVSALLQQKAAINVPDKNGATALHFAAIENNYNMVNLLLQNGANVNAGDEEGKTPLFFAEDQHIAELLWEHGADIYATDMDGNSLLHFSTGNTFFLIEWLLEKKVPVDLRNLKEKTPLHICAQEGFHNVIPLLLQHGADYNAQDYRGRTPLHLSAQKGEEEAVEILLAHGADPLATNLDGQTPLHIAALSDNENCVEILIQCSKDINLNAQDKDGNTPLHYAAELNFKAIASILIHPKRTDIPSADPLKRNNREESPLEISAEITEDPNLFDLMFDSHSSRWKLPKKDGKTLLHHAAAGGSLAILERLINAGLSIHQKDEEGCTPLHYAALKGNQKAMEFFLERGADIFALNKKKQNLLHMAANNLSSFQKISPILMKHGLHLYSRDDEGSTPLHILIKNKYLPNPKLLSDWILKNQDYLLLSRAIKLASNNKYHKVLPHLLYIIEQFPNPYIKDNLLLLYHLLQGERQIALDIMQTWQDSDVSLRFENALNFGEVMRFLAAENPSLLEVVDIGNFSNEKMLHILPLFPPQKIYEIVTQLSEEKKQSILVKPIAALEQKNILDILQRLDPDLLTTEEEIISLQKEMNGVPFAMLAVAASIPEYQHVLLKFAKNIFESSILQVVIPHFPDSFLKQISFWPIQKQKECIAAMTEKQRIQFLELFDFFSSMPQLQKIYQLQNHIPNNPLEISQIQQSLHFLDSKKGSTNLTIWEYQLEKLTAVFSQGMSEEFQKKLQEKVSQWKSIFFSLKEKAAAVLESRKNEAPSTNSENEDPSCVICLDSIMEDLVLDSCSHPHTFHAQCVEDQVKTSGVLCPITRQPWDPNKFKNPTKEFPAMPSKKRKNIN